MAEAIVIICDNSEFMINGDLSPTRLQAQREAINYLVQTKGDRGDTTIGLLSSAGKRPDLLVSPCNDSSRILNALPFIKAEGRSDILASIKIAQLALKNRPNKNQQQRVIMFVGSPIPAAGADLVKIGKLLKKNNIALDTVSFGRESAQNVETLRNLFQAVNNHDNSHFVDVPAGQNLSDSVVASLLVESGGGIAAVQGGGGAPAPAPAAGGAAGDLGFDPNLDPELAVALRVSIDEERERQRKATPAAPATTESDAKRKEAQPMHVDEPAAAQGQDEDALLLARAIAMSMAADESAPAAAAPAPASTVTEKTNPPPPAPAAAKPKPPAPAAAAAHSSTSSATSGSQDISATLTDPAFMDELIGSLPVNKSEIDVNEIIASLTQDKKGGSSASSASSSTDAKKKDEKKDEKKPPPPPKQSESRCRR